MSEQNVMNRFLVVVGALLIQFSLGAIYAWSVFTKPLVDAGWTQAQTQVVFAAGLASFAIVMVLAALQGLVMIAFPWPLPSWVSCV